MNENGGKRKLFEIRQLSDNDFINWKTLWKQYLEFYKTSVEDLVYETTFKRLISSDHFSQNAFVAEQDNELIGLVHLSSSQWKIEDVCYLQIYHFENCSRYWIGRALMETVYLIADRNDTSAVYWLTRF